MAINQAIIRIRRGLKDELQIDKLLPGELAMATDAPCMWFCWSPGEVEQVPTSGNVIEHINEIVNEYIANNDISVIGKVFMRIYNGWIQYSPDEKTWENVISLADIRGDEGGYYIPVVNNNGTISWQPSQDGMEELQDSLILSKEIIESVLGYVPLKKTDVVDNLLSDAEDLPLSARQGKKLNTNFAVTGENPLYVNGSSVGNIYKYGRVVQLTINNLSTKGAVGDTLFTLDSKYYPLVQVDFKDTYGNVRLQISQSGKVMLNTELTTGAYIRGTFTYISAS